MGTARLELRSRGDERRWIHESRMRARGAVRRVHEEVRTREGRFVAGWATVRTGDEVSWRQVVREGDALRITGPEGSRRVGLGGEAPYGAFDAPAMLARAGRPGDRLPVVDVSTGRVGEVRLVGRHEDGSVETVEFGVRVRSRWIPGSALPVSLALVDPGLAWVPADGAPAGGEPAGEGPAAAGEAPSVRVRGRLRAGARVRLTPPDAWPSVPCAEVRLTASGAACPVLDAPDGADGPRAATRSAPAGPRVLALARDLPRGGAQVRAAALARRVKARLSGEVEGAGLWEADPESALARGAGDCNEAAAVFLAAAPLAGLKARRRTGLVLDPAEPDRLWPHAWVEVEVGGAWVRVDPTRGEAPARGVYLDLGDGSGLGARMRAVAPALRGASVEVCGP